MKLLQKVKKIENKTKQKLHGDEAARTAKLRSLKTLFVSWPGEKYSWATLAKMDQKPIISYNCYIFG